LKQYRGPIIFFSVMIALFVLLQLWHARSASEDKKEERERNLKGIALIMNTQSQKTFDGSRIDSVTYKDEVMRISITLTNISKDEVDLDAFTKDRKDVAAAASCDEKFLGPFVRSGLLVNYTLNDASNAPLTEFQIGKSDCL